MTNRMSEATRRFLQDIAAFPPLHEMTPEAIRQAVVANVISDRPELASTEDVALDGPHGPLPVRIYRPSRAAADPLPVIVFFHGGGFVFNRMAHYDPMCGKLATETGHAVVSVDYRLAPEHQFPVPVDEALHATQWVFDNARALGFDPARLTVAGESVGGNLAAVLAQHAAGVGDFSFSVAGQILLSPLTDWVGDYESRREFARGYFLETALLEYCAAHYLNGAADRTDPLASPIYGDATGTAPALVVTAEYDPLRDEGEAYARKLAESGVTITLKRYPGMIHTFYAMTDVFEDGHDVYVQIRQWLHERA